MKQRSSLRVITILILLSAAIYAAQLFLFHDPKNTAFYLLQDFAFLPVQVALVTVIAGKIIKDREKEQQIEKTRMLTGSFFTDVGGTLLRELRPCIVGTDALAEILKVEPDWTADDFLRAETALRVCPAVVNCTPECWDGIGRLLRAEKMPLLVISSNPALLEHEDFTDMLWATFHLVDEYAVRPDFAHLSPADQAHLNEDLKRVLLAALVCWVQHAAYLRQEYPYLFLSEKARNPFCG